MTDIPANSGILLVGHGTQSEAGRGELLKTAAMLAERLPLAVVQPGFLEMARPTIGAGLRELAARGVARVTVMPLLLFAAGHAKRDIPGAVRRTLDELTFERVAHAQHLGCHPRLVQLSRRRFQEAVAGRTPVDPAQSLLLLVGRGSRDAEATAEMQRFAELRQDSRTCRHGRVAFLAMAQPQLDRAIADIECLPVRRVVVQPHLLFHGDLLSSLRSRVAAVAARRPQQQWVLTGQLGPSVELVDATLDRCLEAESSYSL